jgi:hypothetical protein
MSKVLDSTPLLPSRPKYPEWERDGVMVALWKRGKDTYDIARLMGFTHESEVANRLAHLRDTGALA